MAQRFSMDDVRASYKPRDAWWTVLLVDPIAGRLVLPVANRTHVTPNQLTVLAAALGIGAAWSLWQAGTTGWIVGAILFHVSFVIDCMDGKLARLKRNGSFFGVWLDFLFDRIRDLLCALALFGGLARETGQEGYLYLGIVFVSFNLFRYLNAGAMAKVRRSMNDAIVTAGLAPPPPPPADQVIDADSADAEHAVGPGAVPGPGVSAAFETTFYRRVRWYPRLRDALLRRRIRSHLYSGIEFQMTVFVVAPLLQPLWNSAVAVLTIIGGLALMLFEVALIGKLAIAARDCERSLAGARPLGA
jgi:phosphatidylglycerophosphate synthase